MFNHRSLDLLNLDLDENPLPDVLLDAVKDYALCQDIEKVDDILTHLASQPGYEGEFYDEMVQHALYHYAFAGWSVAVNQALTKYSALWVEALRGYQDGGHFADREALLRLLIGTESSAFRAVIAWRASRSHPEHNALELLKRANVAADAMAKYTLNYEEARVFLMQGEEAIIWLLQGSQLVQNGVMPYEIFLKISEYVTGLSGKSVEHVHAANNQRVLDGAKRSINNNAWHKWFMFCCRHRHREKLLELSDLNMTRGNFYNHS